MKYDIKFNIRNCSCYKRGRLSLIIQISISLFSVFQRTLTSIRVIFTNINNKLHKIIRTWSANEVILGSLR